MKRAIPALAAVTAISMLFLTSCVSVTFDSVNVVEGKGPIVAQSFEVSPYTAVELNGNFELRYSNEPSNRIQIELNENLASYLTVENINDTLQISFDESVHQTNGDPIVYISTPDLREIHANGGLQWDEHAKIENDESFLLNVAGACAVDLDVNVKQLDVMIAGAGLVELSGTADTAGFVVSGASSIEGLDLETVDASIEMDGAGTASISCSGKLDAQLSGLGSIEYRGDCTVNQDISSMGAITKID